MNEIDLYFKLIDEKESNSIIDKFCLDIKSENLEYKKTKMRMLLKNPIAARKGKKHHPFTFELILVRHKEKHLSSLTNKEYLNFISDKSVCQTNLEKLANYILDFPNEFEKINGLIKNNVEKNKDFFDFDIHFENDEELTEYLKKISILSSRDLLLGFIDKLMTEEIKDDFLSYDNELETVIKDLSLLSFYDYLQNVSDEIKKIILKYIYIKTHANIDYEILSEFCIEIMSVILLISESKNKHNITNEEYKTKYESSQIQLVDLKESIKEMEKNKKDNDKILKAEIKEIEEKLSIFENSMKIKEEVYKQSIKDLKTKNEVNISILKKNNEKSILELENKNKENTNILKDNNEKKITYERQLFKQSKYMEYTFPQVELDEQLFGLIYSMNIDISKTIFKEILFIPYEEWKEMLNNLTNVKKIYIQREGISSKQLSEVTNYCNNKNYTVKLISISNEKMLIEKISLIKNELMGCDL